MNRSHPTISIIIPCRNEERYIGQCIDSFLQSPHPFQIEILVMDGMSTDNTREVISERQKENGERLYIIDNPHKTTPHALNIGIDNAQGEYILIASAHSSFDAKYISDILAAFSEWDADVIGGAMKTRVLRKTSKSISIKRVLSNKFGVGNSMFRIGVAEPTYVDTVPFGIYKSKLLRTLGGYDIRLIRNHDMELSKRILAMGYKILLLPKPHCYYYARETFSELFQNNFRNGNWNLKTVYITRKFTSLSIRHFIPLAFLLSIVLPLILSVIHPPLAWLSLISLGMYLSVIFSQSVKIKKAYPSTNLNLLVIGFVTLHVSYGLGSLLGLFALKHLVGQGGH